MNKQNAVVQLVIMQFPVTQQIPSKWAADYEQKTADILSI